MTKQAVLSNLKNFMVRILQEEDLVEDDYRDQLEMTDNMTFVTFTGRLFPESAYHEIGSPEKRWTRNPITDMRSKNITLYQFLEEALLRAQSKNVPGFFKKNLLEDEELTMIPDDRFTNVLPPDKFVTIRDLDHNYLCNERHRQISRLIWAIEKVLDLYAEIQKAVEQPNPHFE